MAPGDKDINRRHAARSTHREAAAGGAETTLPRTGRIHVWSLRRPAGRGGGTGVTVPMTGCRCRLAARGGGALRATNFLDIPADRTGTVGTAVLPTAYFL